jgi:foldase protein PrsA
MERSMDSGSRSLGGLLGEPICRHAYPQTVSDAAFFQLVDGDAKDKDASHKPKDGDFTGPIQVAEATWVILRREGVIPAQRVDPKSELVRKSTYEMIYEVKLKEEMGKYMVELMEAASINNKLTGTFKEAGTIPNVDQDVKLMGGRNTPPSNTATLQPVQAAGGNGPQAKTPLPAGLPPEVVKQAESLSKPSK